MLRTFPNGTIEWFIDRDRHVVLSRWEGDVRGDELLAESPAIWRQHPEIALYSSVHDLIDFTGVIEHRYGRELMQSKAAFFGPDIPSVRTAIVSLDPMKIFELKVTTIEQPDRQFRLFDNNRAALEWVIGTEAGDPPILSDGRAVALPWWFDRLTPAADLAG
jgi:hypothetical protein